MRAPMLFFAVAMAVPAAPVPAKPPAKIAVTPASKEGGLLIRVRRLPMDWTLEFSRVGSNSGFLGRSWLLPIGRSAEPEWAVRTMKPGLYRLDTIFQQGTWGGCLGAKTITVRIVAGEIAYLGRLDPGPTLIDIARIATEKDQLRASAGTIHVYHDGIAAPLLDRRDEAGLAEADAFVRRAMPRSSAPVRLAEISETRFEVSAGNRAMSICGGE